MAWAGLDDTTEIPDQSCWSQKSSPSQGGKEAGTQQPVVILLGWDGRRDKNSAKYSAIYPERGCILLGLLFDYEIEREPRLLHVLSSAGLMLCRGSLELLWAPLCFCHLPMVGTIFDSGPGDSNLVGALAALAVILDHQSALTHLWLLVTFTPVAVLFHILLAPLTALFHTPCFDELQNAGSRWPGLYFSSRADEVVLTRDVERMVEARLAHLVLCGLCVICTCQPLL
ncbi:transmembrane protein 53-like isoform X2 [Sciurus carolinensis]|uniref:transmembrane protein 53-like isoform X2 n=1 Tax=Sciurus carolinensis TaxID=30640 RepID=UPI001FB49D63|nr:transmembrane protein 53-like isoform X2 [Sciurus carolinensis]